MRLQDHPEFATAVRMAAPSLAALTGREEKMLSSSVRMMRGLLPSRKTLRCALPRTGKRNGGRKGRAIVVQRRDFQAPDGTLVYILDTDGNLLARTGRRRHLYTSYTASWPRQGWYFRYQRRWDRSLRHKSRWAWSVGRKRASVSPPPAGPSDGVLGVSGKNGVHGVS
jgi:hypothetical protein